MAKPHLRSGEVERALRAAPAHALPEALAGAVTARFPQVTGARLYLVDYRLASLLPAESPSEHEPIAVPGTPAGRAFASLRPVPDPAGSRARRVFVPVAARGDRMGVLALDVDAPAPGRTSRSWPTSARSRAARSRWPGRSPTGTSGSAATAG
ncbi:hypothetical protein ACFQHO_11935 [Actinomadura yumaensis]|uniref:hypothetical protein n=1 Tax=Actinomadura yumaensis TaxID=111807 RepID=UPI003619FBD9